jgi:hypothetical protein
MPREIPVSVTPSAKRVEVGKLLAPQASLRRALVIAAGGAHTDASKAASEAVVPSMTARSRASSMVIRLSRALRSRSSTIPKAHAAGPSTVNRAMPRMRGQPHFLVRVSII